MTVGLRMPGKVNSASLTCSEERRREKEADDRIAVIVARVLEFEASEITPGRSGGFIL